MLARGQNVKNGDACGCWGTTDRQRVSTLFLLRTVHSEPCYGTIAPALPVVMGNAELQVPGRGDIFAQAAALSVRDGRTGQVYTTVQDDMPGV
jgi:hypothetical protein